LLRIFALSLFLLPALAAADEMAIDKGFLVSEEEKGVLDRTNAERKAAGLSEFVANEKLFQAARGHSMNMARKGQLNHTLDGKGMTERIRDAGYAFREAGENVAWNQRDAPNVVCTWMNSAGHRSNILNGNYTEIGIGVAINDRGERYWTQVFARPQ
jgi:uncharacterized protein YkwD